MIIFSMTLEELQKERLEEIRQRFVNRFGIKIPPILSAKSTSELVYFESFLSESIRLAYDAAYKDGQDNPNPNVFATKNYDEGFQAGLERSKELVPKEWSSFHSESENSAAFKMIKWFLFLLDTEITKNNER